VNKYGFIGKSDTVVIVDILNGKTRTTSSRLGMTETVNDNLSPVFDTKIEVDYVFELRQVLRITVLDVDDRANLPTECNPNVILIQAPWCFIV
jgi:hypothetical protein